MAFIPKSKKLFEITIRNLIFGAEDSLVSTVGLISGIAIAGIPRSSILISGIILIFVEAFSMAAGSFLSERGTEEIVEKKNFPLAYPIIGGVIMFVSYFVSGFVPLLPYFFAEVSLAFKISVTLSLVALFLLGTLSAKKFGVPPIKSGVRMLIIGGAAIAIGILVGNVFNL